MKQALNGNQEILTGKSLLQKVKELSHLPRRETAKLCGYYSQGKDGQERLNLTDFYDAVLAAKGVPLDLNGAKDGRGSKPTFRVSVNKNGQIVIGSTYTKSMGLQPGDEFEIKLGYKHIHLKQIEQEFILEELETIEVYDYYDQPCLFSCRDQNGQIFIALWVDETELFNTWLYLPVSQERFNQLLSSEIDLSHAFLNSETGLIYEVKTYKNRKEYEVKILNKDQINSDFLPTIGEFLLNQDESILEAQSINHKDLLEIDHRYELAHQEVLKEMNIESLGSLETEEDIINTAITLTQSCQNSFVSVLT